MAEYKGSLEAGARQKQYELEREMMMSAFAREREKIKNQSKIKIGQDRFVPQKHDVESNLKKDTIGLVQLSDFQKIKESIIDQKVVEKKIITKKKTIEKNKLSFDDDLEEESNEPVIKKAKIKKDPNANTFFLPDKEREEKIALEKEKIKQEWFELQEQIKAEEIPITFSYWDGHGHRSQVICKKGDSIAAFLNKAKLQFPQIRGVLVNNLMYVKEDLIIPHHYTFYDFIINKFRGKSGPLFEFDVIDDVRLLHDATKETIESHAGKVVEKSWYDKNKHVFPANRWEIFDENKDYGTYTMRDPLLK